jgi:hypothetical protein
MKFTTKPGGEGAGNQILEIRFWKSGGLLRERESERSADRVEAANAGNPRTLSEVAHTGRHFG